MHVLPARLVAVSLAVCTVGLAACAAPSMGSGPGSAPPTMPAAASSSLLDTAWVGQDLLGVPLAAGSRLSLRFGANGRLAASAGCNRLSAAYRLDGDQLQVVPPMISTRMACPAPLAEQETRFLAFLGSATRHAVDAAGRLVLTTAAGESQRFDPEPAPR